MAASRKLYEEIAQAISRQVTWDSEYISTPLTELTIDVASALKRDNPSFQFDKFYRAAGFPHLASN